MGLCTPFIIGNLDVFVFLVLISNNSYHEIIHLSWSLEGRMTDVSFILILHESSTTDFASYMSLRPIFSAPVTIRVVF